MKKYQNWEPGMIEQPESIHINLQLNIEQMKILSRCLM